MQSAQSVVLPSALLRFRPYQREVFENRHDGIQILLWGRQTGKTFTLAAWAVDRLITRPGRLVTILSNSRLNGIEFNRRCAEVCELLGQAFEQLDLSPDNRFESFNTETRIAIEGRIGRIKVLAADPRTARGFSGDLILDEFAFHEDSAAIWDAAQPILEAHQDYLCRIASTPNGKHNMFYRLCTSMGSPGSSFARPAIHLRGSRGDEALTSSAPSAPEPPPNPNLIPVSKVTRTIAYAQGCPVFHRVTRQPITPEQARALAPNKRAYDQNFECVFEDENMALLTHELIAAAERGHIGLVCEQNWSASALELLTGRACRSAHAASPFPLSLADGRGEGPFLSSDDLQPSLPPFPPVQTPLLFAGIDVGRHRHRTVISVIEKSGLTYLLRAILRIEQMRLPDQQQRLESILNLPNLRYAKIDMTGLGLGLFEYTHQKFPTKMSGINFSSTVPLSSSSTQSAVLSPRNFASVRVTEHLATQLLQTFEDRAIQIPIDQDLCDDLRKPERLVGPTGRVSIAATHDQAGHADPLTRLNHNRSLQPTSR